MQKETDEIKITNSENLEIRPDMQIERSQILTSFKSEHTWTEIMTVGNISAIIGKAKSRKTFFVTMLVAALINNRNIYIKSQLTGNIAWFDTEQGKYHVWKVSKRVEAILGMWDERIKMFCLRPLTTEARIKYIENYVYINDVQFLIIDGIRDLVTDINDANQATEIVGKLMKWSYENEMHICIVIHQNKGDENARGHIGTEIVNKSESVISITKDGLNTTIKSEYTRGEEIIPFNFIIDKGLPVIDMPEVVNYYDKDKNEDEVSF